MLHAGARHLRPLLARLAHGRQGGGLRREPAAPARRTAYAYPLRAKQRRLGKDRSSPRRKVRQVFKFTQLAQSRRRAPYHPPRLRHPPLGAHDNAPYRQIRRHGIFGAGRSGRAERGRAARHRARRRAKRHRHRHSRRLGGMSYARRLGDALPPARARLGTSRREKAYLPPRGQHLPCGRRHRRLFLR